MIRKHYILALGCAILFSVSGCAFFTLEAIGTAVVTHVGKEIVKDAIEKREQKKSEEHSNFEYNTRR